MVSNNAKKKDSKSDNSGQSLKRNLTGNTRKFVSILVFIMVGYHLYALFIGLFLPHIHNAWHMLFVVSLIFLTRKALPNEDDSKIPIRDYIFAALSITVFAYVVIEYEGIIARAVIPNVIDRTMGIIAIILVLEACRRCLGNILPLLAIIGFVYAHFGNYLPGALYYRGASISKIIFLQYMLPEGIFGAITKVSSTIIFMFILFGAFLLVSGGGKIIINLAYSIAGRFTGGPAKVAVISSGLFGSISGSAVANVVTTGQITIPMMKEVGYKPSFAAAVETAASTGGLIMPPIMGAGAFIMAELLGIPYFSVVKAAFIPALLYFISILIAVHFEAKRQNLSGLSPEKLPSLKKTLLSGMHTILPIVILIYLIVSFVPIVRAGLFSIIAVILFSFFSKPENRMTPKKIYQALVEGGLNILPVAVACATANIVVGYLNLTGGGLKFGNAIIDIAGDNLILVLVFTMIMLIIFGMGLPAVAAYVIGASVAAPVLTKIGGIPLLASHLFIFYFSNLAHITPPIAISAYAAAGLANANAFETALKAFSLGLVAFIVPYFFIENQNLLMMGTPINILLTVVSALIGVLSLGAGIIGYLKDKLQLWMRVVLILGSISLLQPGIKTDLIGLIILIAIYIIQRFHCQNLKEEKVM